MEHCYLRFCTAEGRPGGECLLKFQEFSLIQTLVSRPMKLGKIAQNLFFLVIFIVVDIFNA